MVDLDGDFRTDGGAESATRAGVAVIEDNRMVSPRVELLRRDNQRSFARVYAKVAFLAEFLVDGDVGLHGFDALSVIGIAKQCCE